MLETDEQLSKGFFPKKVLSKKLIQACILKKCPIFKYYSFGTKHKNNKKECRQNSIELQKSALTFCIKNKKINKQKKTYFK